MTASPRLIAVGDNCLDVYLSKSHMAVGGNALNVAAQWSRQGLNAGYFGVVGLDAEGDVILEALAAVGLTPEDVERRAGSTAVTLLLERDGDRRFLLEDLGVGLGYQPEPGRHAALRAADWVHLGTNTPAELPQRLVAEGVAFSIDVSTAHDAMRLDGVPLVFASGPEDPAEPIEPVIAEFRARGALRSVITCGRRGAFFDDAGEVSHVPAQDIAVVDTCGAGDSFIASFLAARISGRAGPEALAIATAAAALTCGHEGSFPQPLQPIPAWLFDKYADVIATAEI
ncbi:fructoselysine 6-kinase [Cereibacter changlensis JA139]|uniref:Fructoselysine 6-kinase n=2 Tax=Cereibacter changlensis TaxID=402884 RepID=A0A2T4JNT3_9RHOB|nr:PfkB family carbohydrate kinase [Cereibacter changlensis]PTE19548.1 fructoselysine 6-kinase [Cereibacter changlensis JA139]PZX56443.1 fructoselysine 6-kinase [Cereibacter changlensis]